MTTKRYAVIVLRALARLGVSKKGLHKVAKEHVLLERKASVKRKKK